MNRSAAVCEAPAAALWKIPTRSGGVWTTGTLAMRFEVQVPMAQEGFVVVLVLVLDIPSRLAVFEDE